MAKLFGNKPKWPSTQVVLGAIVKQFDDSWMVFAEVDFRKVTPGIVVPSDADLFLCHPQHGFCFIECKGGGIRRSENKKWQQYQSKDPKKIGWHDIDPNKQAEQAQRVFLEWAKSNGLLKKSFTQRIALVAFPNAKKTDKVYSPDVEKVSIWGEDIDHLSEKILELLPLSGENFFDQSDLRNALVGEIPPLEWILPSEKIEEALQLENIRLNSKLEEWQQEVVRLSKQTQSPGLTIADLKKLNDQQDGLRSEIQSLTQAISSIFTHDELRSDIRSLTNAISAIPSPQGLDDQKNGKLIAAITFVGIAIIVSAFVLLRNQKSENIPSAPIQTFENCPAMNEIYKGGVAKEGITGDTVGSPDNRYLIDFGIAPRFSTELYEKNKERDRDKDGIACEKRSEL